MILQQITKNKATNNKKGLIFCHSELDSESKNQSLFYRFYIYTTSLNTKVALCPPNPNEFESAARTFFSLIL